MDSISDKLKALGVKIGAQDVNPQAAKKDHPIDTVISGRYQATIYGEAFCVEAIYPSDYTHGNNTLKVKHPLKIWQNGARRITWLTSTRGDLFFWIPRPPVWLVAPELLRSW